jgi:hypothetical protein
MAGFQAIGAKHAARTHFDIDEAELAALRELRTAAVAHIVEKRQELEQLVAELAVLDEALAEAESTSDGG